MTYGEPTKYAIYAIAALALSAPASAYDTVSEGDYVWACLEDGAVVSRHDTLHRAVVDCGRLVDGDGIERHIVFGGLRVFATAHPTDPDEHPDEPGHPDPHPDEPDPGHPPDEPDEPGHPPTDPPDEPDPPTEPPVDPPSGPLASIPSIPFNYAQVSRGATVSGTLPAILPAGSVLAFAGQTTNGDLSLNCAGTEAAPAFVLGGTLSGDNDVFHVSGSWCIFEGTVFDNIQVRTAGDHLIFRNVEIANVAGKNGSSFGGSNIVVVDSEIHHNQGDDRHGIHVGVGADSVWILRNHVHHNGGDGFQACHGCSANPPRNVYIGNNLFHSDRENAIDFKYITNVIVEGNTIHSLVEAPPNQQWCFDDGSGCGVFSSGSDGSGIVVGSDGAPTGVVITGNEIYGTVNAIRIEEGDGVQIVDNNFHDIAGRCLQLDKNGLNSVYSNNICARAERGIFQNWRTNFSLTINGNTFVDITGPAIEYEAVSVAEASTLTNNLFQNTGPVIVGNQSYATQDAINSVTGASNNIVN